MFLDINAQTDATFLIVTHNITLARTVPDNLGMLFRRELVMFGPREVLLTSEEPVVKQFLNGRMDGPIGMSEEKDSATMAAEKAMFEAGHHAGGVEGVSGIPPQMQPSPGVPERQGAIRRQQRVLDLLHTLPQDAQDSIKKSIDDEKKRREKESKITEQLSDEQLTEVSPATAAQQNTAEQGADAATASGSGRN